MKAARLLLLCASALALLVVTSPRGAHAAPKFFIHPFITPLQITVTKSGGDGGDDSSTGTVKGGGGAGDARPPPGAVAVFLDSGGQPTAVTADGNRVPVPRGQVVYITPPSNGNGSPGIQGPEEPGSSSPPASVALWNPNGDDPDQPGAPVAITPDGVPLAVDPDLPLLVAWPDAGEPPAITAAPGGPGRAARVPRQANLDCSDMAGTYAWACTCGGRCKSVVGRTTYFAWYPVRAVVSADCSVQMTTDQCVHEHPPATGPARVWGSGMTRTIAFPHAAVCPPGLNCPGYARVDIPDGSKLYTTKGLSCRADCKASRGLPQVRGVAPVRPRRGPTRGGAPTATDTPKPGQPAASTPTGPPSGDFQNAILKAHNNKRAAHNTAPLVWDPTLAAHAQKEADSCPRGSQIHANSQAAHEGENYFMNSPPLPAAQAAEKAVNSWYSELGNYQRLSPKRFTMQTGHVTQVLWRGTKRVGCGYAKCDNQGIVICRYDPQGNILNNFDTNVNA